MALAIFRVGEVSITIGQVLVASLTIIVALTLTGWLIQRLSQRLQQGGRDANQVQLIKKILWFAVISILFFTALGMLNVPLGALAFISGAIAIGIGFGAQNIINNFISGWILMAERPIRIGDFVEIDNTMGKVEVIGNRSTRIRRTDGVHLLVPNSLLLERTVVNWTLIDEQIRTVVRVGVAYGSPVERVAELIMEAVRAQPECKNEPAPSVVFEEFGDNALIFDSYFWCDVGGEKQLREIRSEVRFRISALFAENGITIAFPQRDVHLDSRDPLEIRLVDPKADER